jgi:CxxC motif-containing protein (DUF1111 family)
MGSLRNIPYQRSSPHSPSGAPAGCRLAAWLLLAAAFSGLAAQTRAVDLTDNRLAVANDVTALGKAVFNAQWSPTAEARPAQFDGLGPLFNVVSCAACHVGGGGGLGPAGSGTAPLALEVQLESRHVGSQRSSNGDPVYGHVLNTAAVGAAQPEGAVMIEYRESQGYYYPYSDRWHLRIPRYKLVNLSHGPMAPDTVVMPRLAPALFGVGLLERVPESGRHVEGKVETVGRFGWQAGSVSIRDQVSKAFAGEMGLTSKDRPNEDCTQAEPECLQKRSDKQPEVSDERLDALVAFVASLAVPEASTDVDKSSLGSELFAELGCAACHRAHQPIEMPASGGQKQAGSISPYTDLQLHDLGMDMADEDVAGEKIPSRWRTAPLWGLGYRIRLNSHTTFLHDGRARTPEEAILWHGGEAAHARAKFMDLGPRSRRALLQWIETL